MSIDFFKKGCKNSSTKLKFGLCDDDSEPDNPAYIDEINKSDWLAEITNPNSITVDFYAVDKCIEIRRQDGSMEKRCDGMLHYENKLIFVELKNRTFSGWVADGREQLTTTYNVFKSNPGNSLFTEIEGYICNKQRPVATGNHMIQIQRFRNDTGLKLNIQRIINL